MRRFFCSLAGVIYYAHCASAGAGALSVSPVTLDLVTVSEAASSITVTNVGVATANVQIRVLRWTQADGQDRLEPTDVVAVSPGITQIPPRADQVVRIVRISQQPIVGEEAYRLLVDELPGPARMSSANVDLVVRQSIPVFFRSPSAAIAPLTFDVSRSGKATAVVGVNRGDVHQKITLLTIRDASGAVRYSRNGLVGYVLGQSSHAWPILTTSAGPVSIQGRTEHGPINATSLLK